MGRFQYTPKTDYKTSKGNVAPDGHLANADYSSSEKAQLKQIVERDFPGARVVRDATGSYNCHAYAHAGRHAWFNDITRFIEDDYYPFTPGTLRVNDVVVYVKDNSITHSGFIKQLNGNTIVDIRSKWGAWPEIVHAPTTVPDVYGSIVYYLRKRGTRFMDILEPTDEELQDKVEDLMFALTSAGHLNEIELASTPSVARQIVAGFPEIPELMLYGSLAGKALVDRFMNADDDELPPLAYAIQSLGYADALPAVANKIAALADDDTISTTEHFLFSAFEALQADQVANRKSSLIDAAKNVK